MAKGYSLNALADVVYPVFNGPNPYDLNTMRGRDFEGKWYNPSNNVAADPSLHYPVPYAGTLEVLCHHADTESKGSIQRYTVHNTAETYTRTNVGNYWSPWAKLISTADIFTTVYPIGMEIVLTNGQNPNQLFPGTTWVQQMDDFVRRAATSAGTNSGIAGNIGSTVGSNNVSIQVANLPQHNHAMSNHTHGCPPHVHDLSGHTHSLYHDHPPFVIGDGGHGHIIGKVVDNADPSLNGCLTGTTFKGTVGYISDAIFGGQHNHTVDIPATRNESDGPSSNQSGSTSFTTYGSADAGNTGVTGNGVALDVQNRAKYVAIWLRTA